MNAVGRAYAVADIEAMFLAALVRSDDMRERQRLSIAYRHWRDTGDVSSTVMRILETPFGDI